MKRHGFTLLFLFVPILLVFGDSLFGANAWFNAPSLFSYYPWKVKGLYSVEQVMNLDPIRQFLPFKVVSVESLYRNGIFPLWNPYILAGMPFFASGTKSVLSIFNFSYTFLDVPAALNWQLAAQFLVAGLFMHLLAFRLTRDRMASLWAAAVYIVSGQFFTVMTFHTTVEDLALAPLLLWMADLAVAKGRIVHFSCLGSLLAVVFLGGLETVFPFLFLLVAAYTIFQIVMRRNETGEGMVCSDWMVRGIVVLGFFAGLSAIKLFPLVEAYLHSSRLGSALAVADKSNLAAENVKTLTKGVYALLSTVLPFQSHLIHRGTVGANFYLGAVPLAFLWLTFSGRTWCGRVRFFAGVVFSCYFLATVSRILPDLMLHFSWLEGAAPSVKSWVGLRWTPLIVIGFVLVLAFSVQSAGASSGRFSGRRISVLVIAWLFLIVCWALSRTPPAGLFHRVGSYFNFWIPVTALALTLCAVWACGKGWMSFRRCSFAVLLVAVLELGLGNRVIHRPSPKEEFYPPTESTELLRRKKGLFRVAVIVRPDRLLDWYSPPPVPQVLMPYRIEILGGFGPLLPARQVRLLGVMEDRRTIDAVKNSFNTFRNQVDFSIHALQRPRLLDMMNIRYLVFSPDFLGIPDARRFRLRYSGELRIYENIESLPRAFPVYRAKVIPRDEDILREMVSETFHPGAYVILEKAWAARGSGSETGGGSAPVTAGGSEVEIRRPSLNTLELVAKMRAPGFVFVGEAHHPGWRAWVDGEPVEILRANYAFQAVRLEAGAHRIFMRYRPPSFLIGLVVSAATFLIFGSCAGFSLWTFFRRTRVRRGA